MSNKDKFKQTSIDEKVVNLSNVYEKAESQINSSEKAAGQNGESLSAGEAENQFETGEDGKVQISVKDSIKLLRQERELSRKAKALSKEITKHCKQIQEDTDTYNDNRFILANYDNVVEDQLDIANTNQAEMDELSPKIKAATTAAASAAAAVVAAKADLAAELKPHKIQRERHEDRIDELQDKLKSIENDIRNETDNNTQISMLKNRKSDIEENISFENDQISSINNDMDRITRRHDAIIDPLIAANATAAAVLSNLQSQYNDAEKAVQDAIKRIKYCERVKEHPEETNQLGVKIQKEKQEVQNLEKENEKTKTQLTNIKTATKKGKFAIGITIGVLAVVIAIVAILIYYVGANTNSSNSYIGNGSDSVSQTKYIAKCEGMPFTMELPNYSYELKDSEDETTHMREISYVSNSPVFAVLIMIIPESHCESNKDKLLDFYDHMLSDSGNIDRGSFEKNGLIGSTQFLSEDTMVTAGASTETLVLQLDDDFCMIKFAWIPGNVDSFSLQEGRAIAQTCINSIEPVVPNTTSLS